MVDAELLESVAASYPNSSWAIWSEDYPGPGCVEEDPTRMVSFILSNRNRLTPNIVFLSLNPSANIPAPYSNWHPTDSKHYDYRLKSFIQDNGLETLLGGYMTDLVSHETTPDSAAVDHTEADIDRFLEQLTALGRREYHVVCFFDEDVYEPLRSHFGEESEELKHRIKHFETEWDGRVIHCYRVWFYGNWGANIDKVEKLEQQLGFLDTHIGLPNG